MNSVGIIKVTGLCNFCYISSLFVKLLLLNLLVFYAFCCNSSSCCYSEGFFNKVSRIVYAALKSGKNSQSEQKNTWQKHNKRVTK